MDKILEDYLWKEMDYYQFPRDVIENMLAYGMIKSPKQAWRTLEKWSTKRLYAWGGTMDLGWKIKKNDSEQ